MKERLLDGWVSRGTSIADFKSELNYLSSITSVKSVKSSDITLLSIDEENNTADKLATYILKPGYIWEVSELKDGRKVKNLRQGFIDRKKLEEIDADDLVSECENNTKLCFLHGKNLFFTSQNLHLTLGLRTGIKGEAGYDPTLERDLLTAKRLEKEDEATLIVRNIDGATKVFAALSGNYTYIPQNLLCDIVDSVMKDSRFGAVDCLRWSVDNKNAEIYLEFPDKASEIASVYEMPDKLVPGLYLSKSDVGECSITVRATWRVNHSLIIADELKRKHTGKINIEDILKNVEKIVFDKYAVLPDKLCELMTMDITDPSWSSTLSASKFMSANEKVLRETIKNVFKQINLVKAIGKKNEKELYESLCEELDTSLSFTAYDIAMMVMQLPSRTSGMNKVYEENFAKACGQAPYCSFEKPKPKSAIVLT